MVTVCLLAKTLCLLTQTIESSPAHMCMLCSVTYACGNAVMRVNRADNAAPDLLCRLVSYAKDLNLSVSSDSHY